MEVLWVLGWSRSRSMGSRMRATSPRESARTSQPWAAALMAPSVQARLSSTTNRDLWVGRVPSSQRPVIPCTRMPLGSFTHAGLRRPKQRQGDFHPRIPGGAFKILMPRLHPKLIKSTVGWAPSIRISWHFSNAVCLAPHLVLETRKGFVFFFQVQ